MGECLETSGDGIPYGGGHPGHWSTGGYIFSSGQTFGFTDGEGDKRLCFTSFPSDVRCLNAKRKKKKNLLSSLSIQLNTFDSFILTYKSYK